MAVEENWSLGSKLGWNSIAEIARIGSLERRVQPCLAILLQNFSAFLVGFSIFLIGFVIIWLLKRRYKQQIFERCGIPGPKPNIITGNFNQLLSAETPNVTITEWIKKYGNVFGYFVGDRPRVIVNDAQAIKNMFIKEFSKFPNREQMHLKTTLLSHTILNLKDERWKKVRSLLTPKFSSYKIRQMTDAMNMKTDKMLKIIEDFCSKDEPFDMYVRVQALTLDFIGESVLALQVNCQEDPSDSLMVAVRDVFKYSNNSALKAVVYFPPLKFLLEFIANYLTAGKMTSMIVDNVEKVIAYRRSQKGQRATDLLQLMLDSSAEQSSVDKSKSLTDNEIIANAYIFLLIGYETTATSLAFSFFLLAKHQDVQERLYQEISARLESKQHPSYEDITNMQYLDQVFLECLRYYPPVTGFVSRESNGEHEVNGFKIPKGVTVQAPIWDIHHDPKFWPNPWTFDPDRFSPDRKREIHQAAFLPFGLGPRNCIGMRVAQIEAKLAIARTVLNYKIIFCEETEDPLTLVCPTVITNPKNGVFLKAVRR